MGDGAPFTVRIGCSDCAGIDDYGCFEGGTQVFEERQPPYAERSFDTVTEASQAGAEAIRDCGPWYYEVIDANGAVVDG